MKRRWIIRSFFLAFLLLLVGGWVASYQYSWYITCRSEYFWRLDCNWGRIDLGWFYDPSRSLGFKNGWSVGGDHNFYGGPNQFFFYEPNNYYVLGFYMKFRHDMMGIAIPFWFPTLLSSLLLFCVWRKTRPMRRGFPVALEKPVIGQTSKPE